MTFFTHLDETLTRGGQLKIPARAIFELPQLCRVQSGHVGLFCETTRKSILVELVRPNEYAGTALYQNLRAQALTDVEIMTWQDASIDASDFLRTRLAETQARLSTALTEPIGGRLIQTLLWLAEGIQADSLGWVLLPPFASHEFISQCVGTSREIITHCIGGYRRDGLFRGGQRSRAVNISALRGLRVPRRRAA